MDKPIELTIESMIDDPDVDVIGVRVRLKHGKTTKDVSPIVVERAMLKYLATGGLDYIEWMSTSPKPSLLGR